LLAALDSDRYVALLENLSQAAADPPLAGPSDDQDREGDVAAAADPVAVGSNGSAPAPEPTGGTPAESPVVPLITAAAGAPLAVPGGGVIDGPAAVGAPPGGGRGSEVVSAGSGPGAGPGPGLWSAPGAARAAARSEIADRRAADVLPALVRRPWRHLQRAVEHLGDDPPDEALHEIRIRAKRMRYAAEAVIGVVGKPARQLASAVAEVQGVLGDMQDAVVAETWLRGQAVSGPPSRAMVAGELITLQRQQQAACRDQWVRPWKAASKRSLRKWLRG
jgi:hypothetical protein